MHVGWFFGALGAAVALWSLGGRRRDGPSSASSAPKLQGSSSAGGFLIFVLLEAKASDLVGLAPSGSLMVSLLDRYQSVGYVEEGSLEASILGSLAPLGAGGPGSRRVAVLGVAPLFALAPGQRPDRAFERRLVSAADRGDLTLGWKSASPGELAELPLLGQF